MPYYCGVRAGATRPQAYRAGAEGACPLPPALEPTERERVLAFAGAAPGQMRTAVRAYAVEGHPPDVVVSRANRLPVGMETDLFAACCYAVPDMEEGDAWCVRAGHLSPLRHPDGSTKEMQVEGGLPPGVPAEGEFPMTAVALAPGAVLVPVTDGLVESASLNLDEGMHRTRDALAVADPSDLGQLADELLGDAGRREDDVALLPRYDVSGIDVPVREPSPADAGAGQEQGGQT